MRLAGLAPSPLSAFLGPSYDSGRTSRRRSTTASCATTGSTRARAIEQAVHHLQQGRLVGWFEGRMEWGPRALGARSILANPFSPYVLENLNRFLKRREAVARLRASALADAAPAHFSGPAEAPFMECDYRPNDVDAVPLT